MNALLIAAAALPALLALALVARGPLRAPAMAAAPWAAAPALLLSLLAVPGPPLELGWLMLGTRVGLDMVGQVFLFFTALLWTAAGVHARGYTAGDPRRRTFFVFFLLTLSGNLGLILARDLATFYAAFAVMTFAAYPMVVHRADAEARRAGRVYVIMAIIGETMLLAGFVMAGAGAPTLALGDVAASVAASPYRDVIVALLLAGFGVKAGALPLHVWLPLAHPVAPTPASAVLSGAMIKAGLLGWLRFLPLGETALPGWGAALIALGLASAFFGVVIGVTQDDPKTALAYSSISQMGIINVTVGVGLAEPRVWPAALAACLIYAVHHGLAKGALFLGVAVAEAADTRFARRWVLAGLAFAGLALAGAPMTSGMVAKGYLKEIAPFSSAWWPGMLDLVAPARGGRDHAADGAVPGARGGADRDARRGGRGARRGVGAVGRAARRGGRRRVVGGGRVRSRRGTARASLRRGALGRHLAGSAGRSHRRRCLGALAAPAGRGVGRPHRRGRPGGARRASGRRGVG